ncbi:MAG: hypothetical protein RLY57_755, partial [Candidatus Parcubacteria bacterium]
MTSAEIRKRFLDFFAKRGHVIIPSASLVPENDPTVLFNTAGMQPLVPYLMGNPHPQGNKLADVQKCVRTNDIEEVGDNTHLTFFEMLGNWSLGSYFKQDAIKWSYELLTSKEEGFGLDPRRLYVTCFEGDENAPKDEEAAARWKEMFDKDGVKGNHIFFLGADANWWPAVKNGKDTWSGPTGPCSEMFYDLTGTLTNGLTKEEFLAADEKQQVVEIWNDVFMEYVKENGKIIRKLEKQNVDTGSGLERVTTVLQGKTNVFDTDLFKSVMDKIEEVRVLRDYSTGGFSTAKEDLKAKRIIADHMRSAVFLISDGVEPSKKDQGYILRKLLRRASLKMYLQFLNHETNWVASIINIIIEDYKNVYKDLEINNIKINNIAKKEIDSFYPILVSAENKMDKVFSKLNSSNPIVSSEDIFHLVTTDGIPLELISEIIASNGFG